MAEAMGRGRVALVTGASSGIGAAAARLLAGRGMRVVVNYLRSAAAADQVASEIRAAGGQAMAVRADVRDPAAVATMIKQVPSRPRRWRRRNQSGRRRTRRARDRHRGAVLPHRTLIPRAGSTP